MYAALQHEHELREALAADPLAPDLTPGQRATRSLLRRAAVAELGAKHPAVRRARDNARSWPIDV